MKKTILLTFVICCVVTSVLRADPPLPPSGKKWVKVENMSDEFDGTSLDMSKWDNQDAQWAGRKPGLFLPEAVTVGGGKLRITTAKLATPTNGYTHRGGLVRSLAKAKYGYYECRMKANHTFMSSTFWLINRKNDIPSSSCDFRTIELDVTENVGINTGGASWINNMITQMNSNTHSRNVKEGCNTPVGQNKGSTALGNKCWEDYHLYGVWWKNANEILFYLDNQYKYTIHPPADFDLDMYLRMVVETYDWNPPRDGSDGMNDNWTNRTTFYDWVRSWKLVDAPTGPNTVSCANLPSTLQSSTSYTFSVPYQASESRDVVLEFWESGTWKMNARKTVSAGSGTASLSLSLPSAPAPGASCLLKVSIRPVGTNYTANLDACQKSVSIAATCDVPWTGPDYSVTKASKTWISDPIDISCASAVNISMTAEGTGPMENSDYLKISYKVNGGNAVSMFSKTNAFPAQTASANNISGNTLQIIIEGKTSWDDETYTVKNLKVSVATKSARIVPKQDVSTPQFSVYPNPVDGEVLTIHFRQWSNPWVDVQVYNSAGQLMLKKSVQTHGGQRLNVASLDPGLYLIKAGNSVQKVVIH